MGLILLAIGAYLTATGRIHLGNFHEEGRHVRAAGVVLMLPTAGIFVVTIFFAMLFAGNIDALYGILGLLYGLELIAMIIAVGIAYILLVNPPNAPKLPGILGEIQAEANGQPSEDQPKTPNARTAPQRPTEHPLQRYAAVQRAAESAAPAVDRASFPKIVNIAQAAQYLRVSEEKVRALIDAGQLPASRNGGGYVIAKSVLDELLAEQAAVS